MARTPESDQAFFRQVDEELRRDRAADLARRHGRTAAIVVAALLVLLGAALWWRGHRAAQAGLDGEALAPVVAALGEGGSPDPAPLKPLERSSRRGYRTAARLAEAAIAARRNDLAAAAVGYEAVAGDAAVDPPLRDFARVRAVAVRFDALPPAQVIDRLKGLAIVGNPWFGSAGEMTALALLKQGQRERAGRLLAQIAADLAVPASIRGRAAGLATSLGQAVRPPAAGAAIGAAGQ